MPRRVNLITLLGLVIIIVLSFGISAGAQPANEDAQENTAGPPEAEFNESLSQLERLQNEAEEADGTYRNALHEERRLNDEIARTRKHLAETEESLKEAERNLENRARDIYKHGANPWLEALGQAEDPRNLMDIFGLLVRQLRHDRDEVQELRDAKEALEQTEQELGSHIEEREKTLEEAATNRDNARRAVNEAQEFFNALEQQEREAIEEERARRALEAAEMVFDAASLQEEGGGDEQDRRVLEVSPIQVTPVQEQQSPGEPADEITEEENQDRQAKVARAISETMRELAGQAEPPASGLEQAVNGEEPRLQNPVAEMAADTAKKQADADRQAREAADNVAAERKAKEVAAEQAEAAKKAELAAQQASAEERQKAQAAAEEARRMANLAANEADTIKTTATQAADQATMQREAAEKSATQLATERSTTMQSTVGGLPATPGIPPGLKPTSPGSGGGVVGTAKNYLGQPYVPGGLDCSGFTRSVYEKFGVVLPDSPAGQWGVGKQVQGAPAAGDLVFWSEDGSGVPTHVGIANGDGTTTHSSVFTGDVTVTPIDNISGYMGAKRLF
jgi:cell wall-associated NlpC family hydrolase/peptidoglycan hydrolase CwlO-like protein